MGGQAFRVLVRSITPQGMEPVQVKAEGYDEQVYAADDNVPP